MVECPPEKGVHAARYLTFGNSRNRSKAKKGMNSRQILGETLREAAIKRFAASLLSYCSRPSKQILGERYCVPNCDQCDSISCYFTSSGTTGRRPSRRTHK